MIIVIIILCIAEKTTQKEKHKSTKTNFAEDLAGLKHGKCVWREVAEDLDAYEATV